MANLYLIKRGPRPEHHRAPFHPVIICDKKRVAEWETGWTGDGATVWMKSGSWGGLSNRGAGWLITRWRGFDIDYGHVVRGCELPDGTATGFWREYDDEYTIKDLFLGAVWWSDKQVPSWLAEKGVVYPADEFTQQSILDTIADDGCSGFGRVIPEYWPVAA